LGETLSTVGGSDPANLTVNSIRDGSTIIDFLSTHMMSLGALLVALNFVLRQAKIAVKTVTEIKTIADKGRNQKSTKAASARPSRRRAKVPAVLKTGPVLPELAPVRAAIARHGRVLVELDEKADVTIIVSILSKDIEHRR
jgi:hypothetical protein